MKKVTWHGTFPSCDICKTLYGVKTTAYYDARTTAGIWAYLCDDCFEEYGVGLGLGTGQKLVLQTK